MTTYLGTLETILSQLASFALTDGGTPTLTITGAQFTGDSGVLGKITSAYHLTVTSALASIASALNSNTHVTSASFSDTAANVSANIDALQTLGSKVSGVTLTDGGTPALAITYTQLIADQTTLNTKISGSFTITVSAVAAVNATTPAGKANVTSLLVVDTAANVLSSISSLETLATAGTLTSVTLTGGGTPTLNVTYTQFTSDAAALAAIAGAYNLAVTAVTAGNATSVAANTHVTSISVSDTSANVASNIDSLETIAAQLTTLAVTDGGTQTITITAAQAANDYAALSQLSGTYKVGVSDTAANVSSNIDALQTLEQFATTKLTLTLTDGATNNVNISAVQATNDAGAIGRSSGTFHITVTDTAANVSANFAALQALAPTSSPKLASVVITGGGTPTLALTYTQFNSTTGGNVLGDISGSYHLGVSAVLIANITAVFTNTHVTSVSVTDTAANIGTNLGSLQTRAAGGTLTAVTVSNSATAVAFTYTQLSSDATVLGLFTGTYSFNVTAVSIANASTVLAVSHVASVNISDTAANVVTNIGTLETLAAASELTGIVLTDGGTPSMTMTALEGADDVTAINLITSAYHLTISDTAANIAANIDGLEALFTAIGGVDLTAITATDGATHTVSVSAAQASGDSSAILKITGTLPVTVTDTAANVVAHLSAIEAVNSVLSAIVLTDGGTPNLAITAAQYSADITVINKISGSYTLTVSAVTGTNATTVGSNSHVTSFTVSDSAANISGNLDALEAQAAKITSINVTNPATALSPLRS